MKLLPFKLEGDKKIWILLILLALISVLSVYSSTYRLTMRTGNLLVPISRHLFFLALGFIGIYIMHKKTLRYYKLFVPLVLAFVVICLILVFFIQSEGERRWLFSRSLQPSDIVKVVMVVYLAKVLSDGFGGSIKMFFWRVIFPILLVCILVIRGHTSNAVIIAGVSMLMVFMGATNIKYRFLSILVMFVVLSGYLLFYKDIGRGETASSRITTWISNTFYPSKTYGNGTKTTSRKSNYSQAETAQYAIVSGGLFRIAPGKSFYRKTLSEAHNDYIFAIIVEEYGMAGGIFVIIIYLMLFYRILMVLKKCTRPFTSLLLSGLLILIISQTFIHIGVSVGGLPITGQNLPLISTGGTSIIITCIAFGMILATSRIAEENEQEESQNQSKKEIV
ncbi:MAG: FtsW/RodA/SpoVE family cell cycle protein [Dysgonamonadaceae bacterium]|jgi:cell division protein FtsW|nr:FtsW/RodA/SpoVE family cell cycle protein [Dysgonamonadaceae bacterium]